MYFAVEHQVGDAQHVVVELAVAVGVQVDVPAATGIHGQRV